MGIIPGICTQCGATLTVDTEKEAMVCPYCGTAFVVEKAINTFNNTYNVTNHITAQNVYIQKEEDDFEIIGGVLIKYTGESTDVVIPEGVVKIDKDAFSHTMIQSVKMSDRVVEIDSAFEGCKLLQEVQLSNNLKFLKGTAFTGCESLKSIALPSSLEVLERQVFNFCEQLHTVSMSKKLIHSRGYAPQTFLRCSNLINIYVDGMKVLYGSPLLVNFFYYTQLAANSRMTQWTLAKNGVCMYCGGKFKGIIFRKCSRCGLDKNY